MFNFDFSICPTGVILTPKGLGGKLNECITLKHKDFVLLFCPRCLEGDYQLIVSDNRYLLSDYVHIRYATYIWLQAFSNDLRWFESVFSVTGGLLFLSSRIILFKLRRKNSRAGKL